MKQYIIINEYINGIEKITGAFSWLQLCEVCTLIEAFRPVDDAFFRCLYYDNLPLAQRMLRILPLTQRTLCILPEETGLRRLRSETQKGY